MTMIKIKSVLIYLACNVFIAGVILLTFLDWYGV